MRIPVLKIVMQSQKKSLSQRVDREVGIFLIAFFKVKFAQNII